VFGIWYDILRFSEAFGFLAGFLGLAGHGYDGSWRLWTDFWGVSAWSSSGFCLLKRVLEWEMVSGILAGWFLVLALGIESGLGRNDGSIPQRSSTPENEQWVMIEWTLFAMKWPLNSPSSALKIDIGTRSSGIQRPISLLQHLSTRKCRLDSQP
jgi:hypothetical protein